jgi:hypothetical protein
VPAFTLLLAAVLAQAPAPPATYTILVASEAADAVSHLTFGPGGFTVTRTIPVGLMPNDIDGPHGLAVAPDGRSYFLTFAHGQPNGTIWRMATTDDRPLGHTTLGMFPATAQTTPDGEFVFVVNFNLHGDRVPSSVSVVATDGMLEVARIPTCLMPHGSRITPDGAKHYSACMMDDTLIEIDTRTFKVARHFVLTAGRESGKPGPPPRRPADLHSAHGGHGAEPPPPGSTACSPTWAQPSPDGTRVFVACNGSSEIVDIDTKTWTVTRRLPAGPGVYNLATTHDGRRLLATNRRGVGDRGRDWEGACAGADKTPRRPRHRRYRRRSVRVRLGGRSGGRAWHRRSDRPRRARGRRFRRCAAAGRRNRCAAAVAALALSAARSSSAVASRVSAAG